VIKTKLNLTQLENYHENSGGKCNFPISAFFIRFAVR